MGRRAFGTLGTAWFGGLSLAFALSAMPLRADTPAVTVTAPREDQLRNEVDTFVSSAITRPYGDDSLLRWDHPVCPLVAGMSREAGEFALTRLSQIARSAHVPLGSETCKPNLFVIVAKYPDKFLKLWWHQYPRLFSTREGVAPVKRFIENPRPVRVWYNASIIGGDSGIVFHDLFTGLLGMSMGPAAGTIDYPVFTGPSILGSRITRTVVRNITSAIVVVDPALVSRLNIGQLVDYIGLVGLAEINLDKDLGEAPTILKVFAASNIPPPAEMTDWDKAMLQALYTTPQRNRVQLSQMETATLKLLAAR
ncbi:MAG TPA: hypothetical protein VNZ02_14985 [Steroidobacteraceae bacterium]|jgi:hypothetical protein|nr:hypothetical protein [Steroidobacteraceae bacterium]